MWFKLHILWFYVYHSLDSHGGVDPKSCGWEGGCGSRDGVHRHYSIVHTSFTICRNLSVTLAEEESSMKSLFLNRFVRKRIYVHASMPLFSLWLSHAVRKTTKCPDAIPSFDLNTCQPLSYASCVDPETSIVTFFCKECSSPQPTTTTTTPTTTTTQECWNRRCFNTVSSQMII